MLMSSMIFTNANAIELANKINKIKDKGEYRISIVNGIDGESVVKLEWNWMEDEEEES